MVKKVPWLVPTPLCREGEKGTGPSQEWEFAADFLKQLLSTKSVFISSQKHLDTNFVSRFYPGYLWVCIQKVLYLESIEGVQNTGRASKLFLSDSPPAPAKVLSQRRSTKVFKQAHPSLGSVGSVVYG